MEPTVVLTIAGSDSGGGAGAQADLRTFAALGVHGTTALTGVTAQNTYEVRGLVAVGPEMVRLQVEAVTDDFAVAAVKTGMLASPETVLEVAALSRAGRLRNLVVDPVLVSSTGQPLMGSGGVDAYRESLIPEALIATPNLHEAAALVGADVRELSTVAAMTDAGQRIRSLGAHYVLVKGGHFAQGSDTEFGSPDVLVGTGREIYRAERIRTENDHGTGCSLAAAIAARLALGDDVPTAVRFAKSFVLRALRRGADWHLGKGRGPIDHLGWNS